MKYYRYRPDANNFAGIGFSQDDNQRIVDVHYTDTPLADRWVAPVAHGFEDNPETQGDFPSLSNFWRVPVVSQPAWDALNPLIGYCCEALPIIHLTGKPYYIVHVMETVDCLDTDRSEVKRFSDGGIMRIVRYSFRHELLPGKHIFKLPRKCAGDLIVDDDFREAVEANALKGLNLKQLPPAE